jgi:hypothetical protein
LRSYLECGNAESGLSKYVILILEIGSWPWKLYCSTMFYKREFSRILIPATLFIESNIPTYQTTFSNYCALHLGARRDST